MFDRLPHWKCRFGHGRFECGGCHVDPAGRHEKKTAIHLRDPLNEAPLTDSSPAKEPEAPVTASAQENKQ